MDEAFAVEVQDGLGFLFVNLQALTDDIQVGIIQAVVLERAALHPGDEVFLFLRREIKHGDDVEVVAQHFGLMDVARDAVEHEGVGVGMKPPHLDAGRNEVAPQFNGRAVGHERTFAGVFDENFSEVAVRAQVPEHVAAGAMEETGDRAERAAMRALAGAGRAKHQNGFVFHASKHRTSKRRNTQQPIINPDQASRAPVFELNLLDFRKRNHHLLPRITPHHLKMRVVGRDPRDALGNNQSVRRFQQQHLVLV